MRKYVLIAIAVLIVGGGAYYVYSGGLNSIEYTVENVSDYHVVGRMFEGELDAEEIEEYFFEAKDLVFGGLIDGNLTMVHYNDSTLGKKETKLFIGVLLNQLGDSIGVPSDYELIIFKASKAVRASIYSDNSVRPGASTIEERLKEKAKVERLNLQNFTIEKYLSEEELVIDMLVKY